MYPTNRLETPPPASRFRRPWSPEPFDPNPRHSSDDVERGVRPHVQQRREPSDVSVEALDLADYALTLARQRHEQVPPVFEPYSAYPPSPRPLRSLSRRASASTPPLLSPSLSSASHAHSGASLRSPAPTQANHRAFSFPAPQTAVPYSVQSQSSYTGRHSAAHERDPLQTPPLDPDAEIDIAQFPAFTRGWYTQPKNLTDPLLRYAPFQRDPFDPSFPIDEYNGYSTPPPLYASPPVSSYASHSHNNLHAVPWNADPSDGRPIDAEVKEERMRMLERAFGKDGQGNGDDEEHAVGSVDPKGRLITEGPKKRTLVRWLQVLLALLAGGSSIYAAAFIKPPSPPPPASKPPAYVLYILSVITFLLTTYLFILYPVCCGARRRKAAATPFTGGMMVLPVQGLPGGKPKKKGNKKNAKEGDGVQVNLIVDPGMFNGDRLDDEDADEETSESESTMPGTYSERSRRSRRRRRAARRRGIFAGLALETQWKHARKMLKWGMAVDMLMLFAWGAEFVYILIGKRCSSGSFDGWCDAYNVATAASCLLCLAFGFSIFFDIKDLHASKSSPRTRT